jgi:hypothetical protein
MDQGPGVGGLGAAVGYGSAWGRAASQALTRARRAGLRPPAGATPSDLLL